MKIKKFEAKTLRDAMEQAKVELGENALILNTREIKPLAGAPLGSTPVVELVAAADETAVGKAATAAMAESSSGANGLAEEVAALRGAFESLIGEGILTAHNRPSGGQERKLRDAGLDASLAAQVCKSIRETGDAVELAQQWACLFNCREPRVYEDGPTVIALVGSTGSGKSTTIAKLAAHYKFSLGKRVAIITCDTLRIGADHQLRAVADALTVPFRVCMDSGSLSAALDELLDNDLVFVDTTGISPRDGEQVARLHDLLLDTRIQKHLVIPANLAADARAIAIQALEPLEPERIIITKVDEIPCSASVLATSQTSRIPMSFLTHGQAIPGCLRAAVPEELALLVMTDLLEAA